MNEETIRKAGQIIAANTGCAAAPGSEPYCTLALIDEDHYPTVSTITAAKSEGINWLTFGTGLSSNKANRIRKSNRASVCFCSPEYNITLVGTIEIVTDPKVKEEMWYPGLSHHFNKPDHPDYCVLRFKTRRYNLLVDWQEAEGTL